MEVLWAKPGMTRERDHQHNKIKKLRESKLLQRIKATIKYENITESFA